MKLSVMTVPVVRALAASVLLASCGDKSLPDVVWESEHFVYKTRTSEQAACPDVLTGLEEHFDVMQGALGFSWPAGEKITYLKFLDGEDLAENSDCPGGALGCIDDLSVQTPFPFDAHELVHAYLWPTGYPPWMLLEGAAVALSCQLGAYPPPSLSWRDAYASDRQGGALRGAGGWLSGFALRHRPVGNFLELYSRAGHDISPDAFAALFEEILRGVAGRPLERDARAAAARHLSLGMQPARSAARWHDADADDGHLRLHPGGHHRAGRCCRDRRHDGR